MPPHLAEWCALWKKHPEFTAKQVIEKLGPKPFMTVKWVQQIMKECWRASARHSPKQWRKGRRFYHSWRGRPRGAIEGAQYNGVELSSKVSGRKNALHPSA